MSMPTVSRPAEKRSRHSLDLKRYGMMIALIIIFVIFTALSGGKNARPININNLIMQNSYVIILAVGMLLCVLTGNVDLSVGSVVAFTGAECAIMILDMGLPIWLACLITLATGLLVGAWAGFFIAVLKVPPFIVTLANMLIFRGLTMTILNGQTKGPMPTTFTPIGAGYLPKIKVPFGDGTLELLALAAGIIASVIVIVMELHNRKVKQKYCFAVPSMKQTIMKLVIILFVINFFTTRLALYEGLPVVLVIILALTLAYSFLTGNTMAGRQIYAVGGNAKAARLSGIKTDRVMFWVYANMGLLCALAGIVLSARNGSATPKAGDGFELDAIAACYIGGASTYGGSGTIVGALVGALIMGVLNNGMSLIGWTVDIQRVVKGLVLLGAVTVDLYSKSKNK